MNISAQSNGGPRSPCLHKLDTIGSDMEKPACMHGRHVGTFFIKTLGIFGQKKHPGLKSLQIFKTYLYMRIFLLEIINSKLIDYEYNLQVGILCLFHVWEASTKLEMVRLG